MTTTVRRVFYARAYRDLDGVIGMQDGGDAPAPWLRNPDHDPTTWLTGGTADPNFFGQLDFQAAQTVFTPAHVVTTPSLSPLNCYRVPKSLTGTFAAGDYDFSAAVAATVQTGTISGRMHFNLYRGHAKDGTGAVLVNGSDIVGSTVTDLLTTATQASTVTVSLSELELDEEYLFLVLEWEVTSPGDPADGVTIAPGAATFFRSSAFTLPSWAPVPQYEEVDFPGAGFDSPQDPDINAYCDVSRDSWGISTSRGRNFNAQQIPTTEVGRIESTFTNLKAVYSRTNKNGPLYGNLKPKRAIRARIAAPIDQVYFTGEVDTLTPLANTSQIGTASMTGLTEFIELTDNAVIYLNSVAGVDTGTARGLILDQVTKAGGGLVWTDARRRIATGDVTIGLFTTAAIEPQAGLDNLDQDELGVSYPGADGFYVAENRNYRRDTERCQVSAITFSDDPDVAPPSFFYSNIKTENPPRLHFDRIKIDFTPSYVIDSAFEMVFGIQADGLGVVGGIPLQPGETKRFSFTPFMYPFTFNAPTVAPLPGQALIPGVQSSFFIKEWQNPVTTFLGDTPDHSQIVITGVSHTEVYISNIVTDTQSISLTLSNSNPTTTAIVLEVLLFAKKGRFGAPVQSIVGGGVHEYPLPGKDYTSIADANEAGRYLLAYLGVDREWVTITVPCAGNPELLAKLMAMEISGRYRVIASEERTGLAMDAEFFLENIKWVAVSPGQFTATILGSGCLPNGQDSVDGTSALPVGAAIYYTMNESSGAVKDSLSTHYNLTRIGTTAVAGVVGPGQHFDHTLPSYLYNGSGGIPDTDLLDDWEWNGFVLAGPSTSVDEYLLQKDYGDLGGAYGLRLLNIDGTHRYFSAWVRTTDGIFTVPSNGLPVLDTSVHWVRLFHHAAAKTLSYSIDLGPPVKVVYTGTIVSNTAGVILGGTTSLGTLPNFDNWYKIQDLTTLYADGDEVTVWPDRSGNSRDALPGGMSGHVTYHASGSYVGPMVSFDPGHLRFPEVGHANIQMFIVAELSNGGPFGTTFLRSSSASGPNYALGRTTDDKILIHAYSHNNDDGVKQQTSSFYPWPITWALYGMKGNWATSSLELDINGALVGLIGDGTSISGAQGIDADDLAILNVTEIIIAHDLTSGEYDTVTNYLLLEAGLGGSGVASNGFGGTLDEWGHYTQILSDADAVGVYNNGLGTGLVSGGPNSFVPPAPPTSPVIIQSGGVSSQPSGTAPDQLYFATDLNGGTLQRWNGTSWVSVAPGLTEDIPKALIDAKGDLIVGASDNIPARLGVGSNGQLLTARSGATDGVDWEDPPPPAIPESLIDAKGDLIVGASDNVAARLGVGTDGQVLTAHAASTDGIEWADLPMEGEYRALVYSSPDGIHFDLVDDTLGHPVTVLAELE